MYIGCISVLYLHKIHFPTIYLGEARAACILSQFASVIQARIVNISVFRLLFIIDQDVWFSLLVSPFTMLWPLRNDYTVWVFLIVCCHVMTYNCLSLYEIWTLSCLIDNHFKSFKIILYCKKHMYHLWICQFFTYVVRSNSYTWRFERHSGFLKILK